MAYSDLNFVLISVGSNLGDSQGTVLKAFDLLKQTILISEPKISSLYLSEPVGFKEQPWFINAAISGYTELSHFNFLSILKSLEYLLGRKQRLKWHEREIDLDLLIYSNLNIETKHITLPHPRMQDRKFVMIPSAEISPDIIHSKLKKPLSELLILCNDNSNIYKI